MQPKTLWECLAGPEGPDRQSYRTQALSEYTHTLDKHFKILPTLSLHHALQELVTSAT